MSNAVHPKFKRHFERKQLPNKKPNPKYVDHLEEDPVIADQQWVCMSFVSPENILKQRDTYMFEQFVRQYDFNKSMEKFVTFLNFVSHKHTIEFQSLTDDFKEFVEAERATLSATVDGDFKTYMERNVEDLEKKFMADHAYQTCVRGVMVRGSCPTQEEAELRCKLLREQNPAHDILVGPVGKWMPQDPEAYRTGRVEYLEEELNQLMSEKVKNEKRAKDEFDGRIKESKKRAMEENRVKAEKSGNVLTQTLNEMGELDDVINQLQVPATAAGGADMMDTADVVTGRTDHGQSRLVSGPYAPNAPGAEVPMSQESVHMELCNPRMEIGGMASTSASASGFAAFDK